MDNNPFIEKNIGIDLAFEPDVEQAKQSHATPEPPDNDPRFTNSEGSAKPKPRPRRKNTGASDEPTKQKTARSEKSRSAVAFSLGKNLVRDGATFDEMVAEIASNPITADWCREKGDERQMRRIYEKAQSNLPLIRVVAGKLNLTADAAEDAILQADAPVYQRGNGLFRPVCLEVAASHNRVTQAPGLSEMTAHSLVDELCQVAAWEKFDARAEDWVAINPPANVCQIMLSRFGLWRFPVIAGVITTPTLRHDGTVLLEPGYDCTSRLYHFADDNLRLHPGVHQPTRELAERALVVLKDLLTEFPFVNDVSRSVALSGLITPVVRGAMSVAPLHAFRANTAGTGKSYLADIASVILCGQPCPVASAAPDEAETEKRLVGLLLAGFPLISLDNVNGELGGDLLCQAVERPLLRLRRLGSSDISSIQSCATILCTGNNLRVRGDMVRRTLVSDLDAVMERPELRDFKNDPVAMVLSDRGKYVSAALIIVRAYVAAGHPNKCKPIASFGEWSDLVRSALVWLGCADPVDSMEAAREDDPELADLGEILVLWEAAQPQCGAMTVSEAIKIAQSKQETEFCHTGDFLHPEFHDALLRMFGERGNINSRNIGKWLSSRKGRIVNGRRFNTKGTYQGAVRWRIEIIKQM